MPALTIKTNKGESTPEPVTLVPQLLPFKEIKGLSAKMLRSSFLFRGKVLEAKGEDSESNKSTSLEDILITGSPQKRRTGKTPKKSPRKKTKMGPVEPLAFGEVNRKKGKVAIIAEADGEVVAGKPRPKRKMKCSCHSKTPVELMEALDSKNEPKGGVFSILQ